MITAELIKKTGYTEQDLMRLALLIADTWAKNQRLVADDAEAFDHYDDLHNAFEDLRNDYNKSH